MAAALIAAGELEPPNLRVEIVGRRDVYATVLILSGKLRDPSSFLFIEHYGAFEIIHVESWSPSGRFLVVRQMQRS